MQRSPSHEVDEVDEVDEADEVDEVERVNVTHNEIVLKVRRSRARWSTGSTE